MAEHNSNDHLATPLVTSSLGIAPDQTTSSLANVEPAQNIPQQTIVTTEPSSVPTSTRELIKGLSEPQRKGPSDGFLNRFLAGRQEHGEENPDNNPPAPESNSDNSNNSPSGNS